MKPLIGSVSLLAALLAAEPMLKASDDMPSFRAYPHRHAGFAALRKNDRKTAVAAFRKALAANPADDIAARGLTSALLLDGQYAQAAALAREALKRQPGDKLLLSVLSVTRPALERAQPPADPHAQALEALAALTPQQRSDIVATAHPAQRTMGEMPGAGPVLALARMPKLPLQSEHASDVSPAAALSLAPAQIATLDPGAARRERAQRYAGEAYAMAQAGNVPGAVAGFEQSLLLSPSGQVAADLAYLRLAQKDWRGARRDLGQAIRLGHDTPAIRSELDRLQRRLNINTAVFMRANDPAGFRAGRAAAGFGGSQVYSGLSYRLTRDPVNGLRATARLASAIDSRSARRSARTGQAAAGLALRPIPGLNADFGVERLVDVGGSGRNAWLARAAWSIGGGYDQPTGRSNWTSWTVDAQAAVIGLKRRDIFAGVDARLGRSFSVGNRWTITPYAGASALMEKATSTRALAEVTPGVALRYRPHGISGEPIDLRLDWRRKIGGNAPSANGVTVTIATQF